MSKAFIGLRYLRSRSGLTLQDLGDRLGVTRGAVWAWETGQKRPNADRLPALAAALGCSMEELFTAPAEIEGKEAEGCEDKGENGVFGAVRRAEGRTCSDPAGRGEAGL